MSSTGQVSASSHGSQQQQQKHQHQHQQHHAVSNGSPSVARGPSMVLPPIVAPPPNGIDTRDPAPSPASVSTSDMGRPPLSRNNSLSNEVGLPKVHHILNPPAATAERHSNPPTPDLSAHSTSIPPHGSQRVVSGDRLTPTTAHFGHHQHHQHHHQQQPPRLSVPTGTIDAKKSPFLPSTSQGPAPMSAGPSGPGVNPVLGPPAGHHTPHIATFAGPGPRAGSEYGGISRTASPASTHSSYVGPGTAQGSPHSVHSTPVAGPAHAQYPHQYSSHPQHQHPHQHQHQHQHTHQAPGYQSSQGLYVAGQQSGALPPGGQYRMLTIDTEQGPIQVPVDVQAASKMADEKRKRNAGASARFRQRRKEKEREAAHTITRLENQMRELEGDREYYRAERDYFRDVVYKYDDAKATLVPRLPSPGPLSERKRQASLASSRGDGGGMSPNSGSGAEYREVGERGADDGRILRRRVADYEQEAAARSEAAHSAHSQHQQHLSQQQHQQYAQQHIQQHPHYSPQQQPQPLHHHHHQQHQHQGHSPPLHRSAGPPPPISVQQANAPYSLPTPNSRAGTPGSAPLQPVVVPPAIIRTGSYDHSMRSGGPPLPPPQVSVETRWAAPS